MDELMHLVTKCDYKHSRKRPVNKALWKHEVARKKRYTAPGLPQFPKCNHNQKAFRCSTVTCQDIRKCHKNFYRCSVLKENATCTCLASIPVYDWKKGYETIIKPTTSWHFPFMKSKRFFLTRTKTNNVLVQGEIRYNSERNGKKVITKKNKKITMIQPELIQPNKIIPKRAKLQHVVKLLTTHFGSNWMEMEILEFYKMIQERAQTPDVDNFYEDDGDLEGACDLCEGGFEEIGSHV